MKETAVQNPTALRIAITGASGLVGTVLRERLVKEKFSVTPLIRRSTAIRFNQRVIRWDATVKEMDPALLEGFDVLIHLAGANIAARSWSEEYKAEIRNSRIKGTSLLANTLTRLKKPPKLFLCASAVGYYGDGGVGEPKNESCTPGPGFLAQVCREWEEAAAAAQSCCPRVVFLRLGMVLDKKNGALAKMLPAFRLGLGGRLASGSQMMSWISLEEIPEIVLFILRNEKINGPVNVTSPEPVSNAEFTRLLGERLKRPTAFPIPAFAIRALFGEMGQELLLNGVYAVPQKLLDAGYTFRTPSLKETLERIL